MKRLLLFLICTLTLFGISRADDKTVNFDWSTIYSSVTGSDNQVVNGVNHANGPISITFGGSGTNAAYFANGTAIRWYYSNTMTVSSTNNKITKIVLSYASGGNANTITTDVQSYNSNTNTWEGSANKIVFTVGKNGSSNGGHRRLASVEVTYEDGGDNTDPTPDGETVTDVLTNANTYKGTTNSYQNWNASDISGVNYAGCSGGQYTSIQLRSNIDKDNNIYSGIVSTTSIGNLKKITVKWNSNTASGRTLNIYGKNSAYSSTQDLYNDSNKGELLGTITNPSTELEIKGDYAYVGICSSSGALYLDEIQIEWVAVTPPSGPQDYTALDNIEDIKIRFNGEGRLDLGDSHPELRYSYDPEGIITIDENGNIKAVQDQTGTTTVTVDWDGDEENWNAPTINPSFKVTVLEPSNAPAAGSEFELVTPQDGLEDGKYYVLVTTFDNQAYAMTTETKSSKVLGGVVNKTDEKIISGEGTAILYPTKVLGSSEDNPSWIWNVANDGFENMAFYPGSSTDTKIDVNTSDNAKSTVSFNQATGAILIKFTNADRIIQGYNGNNGPDFRGYTTANNNAVFLYRLVEPKEPKVPVVTLNGVTLTSGGTKVIEKGTEVKLVIESEGATSLIINEQEIELGSNSYIHTVTDNNLEKETISIKGKNEIGDSPEFTYTFIFDTKNEIPSVGSNFKAVVVTDLAKELVAGETYVIARVANTSDPSKNFAMGVSEYSGNTTGFATSQNFNAVTVTPIEGKDFDVITTTGDGILFLTLEEQGNSWGLKTLDFGDGFKTSQGYLSSTADTNNLEVSKDFTPVEIVGTGTSNNISITFPNANDNKIVISSNGNYFNCATNGNAIQLYKYTKARVFTPSFEDRKLRIGEDENVLLNLPEEVPSNLTYNITGDCISIDNNTIIVNGVGEATVDVTWGDDINWFTGKAQFKVTVLPEIVDITETFTFRHGLVHGKVGVGVVSQAVYYNGDGKVVYSIEPTGDINIDSETGMIRPEDIISPKIGEPYTVYARVEATDYYTAGEAQYTIIIEAPAEPSKGNLIENFADNNHWKDSEGNDYKLSGSYGDDEFTITSTDTGIEYSINQGVYQNSSLQLRANPAGYIQFKIPANCQTITIERGVHTANSIPNLAVSVGENPLEAPFEFFEDKILDVTGYDGKVLTIKSYNTTYAARINKLIFTIPVVTTPQADLSFVAKEGEEGEEVKYINMFEKEQLILPYTLSHAKGLNFDDLYFDIDEINEADEDETFKNYVITPTDFNNISVVVNTPGVYTFRAEYDPAKMVADEKIASEDEAEFLKGMAILRLNVFPRLSVVPTEREDDGTLASDERNALPHLTIAEPAEDGSVNIVPPSLTEKGDDLKYSTVTISKITIKTGETTTVYAVDPSGDEKPMTEVPEHLNFTEDGTVTYRMVYANTPDFFIEETVHVVLMPQTPTVDRDTEKGEITLTASKGAKLRLYYEGGNKQNITRRAGVSSEEWIEGDKSVILNVEELKAERVTKVYYQSMKDLSDIIPVDNESSNNDLRVLASDIDYPNYVAISVIDVTPITPKALTWSQGDLTVAVATIPAGSDIIEDDFKVTIEPAFNVEDLNNTEIFEWVEEQMDKIMAKQNVDGFYKPEDLVYNTSVVDNQLVVTGHFPVSGTYNIEIKSNKESEITIDGAEYQTISVDVNPDIKLSCTDFGAINISGRSLIDTPTIYCYYVDGTFWGDEFPVLYTPGNYLDKIMYLVSTTQLESLTPTDAFVESKDNTLNFDLLESNETVYIYVYLEKNGLKSEILPATVIRTQDVELGIESIGSGDGEVEYYDLNGFKVDSDRLVKGIYIRVTNGKAEKVML